MVCHCHPMYNRLRRCKEETEKAIFAGSRPTVGLCIDAAFTSLIVRHFSAIYGRHAWLALYWHDCLSIGLRVVIATSTSSPSIHVMGHNPHSHERAPAVNSTSLVFSDWPSWIPLPFVGRLFVRRFALCCRTVVCPVSLSVTLVYCVQAVGWIKMLLGTEEGLGPGNIVLDGDPALTPPKEAQQPPTFGPNGSPSHSQQLLWSLVKHNGETFHNNHLRLYSCIE